MSKPEYGETWVYEGIIGAIPGLDLGLRRALIVQFLGFETAVLVLAWVYGLPTAALAGTVAVAVATVGSAQMVLIARELRDGRLPDAYRRLVFGSNVATVLAVFTFVGFVTYLFVFDPAHNETPLLETLFGTEPPVLAVGIGLLIVWDVCYRVSASWWAGVTALWRSARYQFPPDVQAHLHRTDRLTAAFGLLQLAFVPFLFDHLVLLVALVGHVVAVVLVTAGAHFLGRARTIDVPTNS